MSFVSFLQEKKTFPFSLEEPAVDPQGKRSAANGQTQANPALSSAGMPRRGMPSSAANPSRPAVSFVSFLQEKKPFPFSLEEPAVGSEGKRSAANGQTQADPALSSAGMPRRGMPLSAANPPRPAVSFVSFLQEKKTFPFSLEEPAAGPQGKAGAYPGPSAVRLRARRAPRAAASCSLRGRAARQSRSRRQGSRPCLRAQCAQARASCRS